MMNRLYATYERAYFDSVGLYINLTRYDEDNFLEVFSKPMTILTIDDWKIYFHEYRHWLDSVSTKYGQIYLDSVFEMLTHSLGEKEYPVSPINPLVVHFLIEQQGLIQTPIKERLESVDKESVWRIDKEFTLFQGMPLFIVKFIKKDGTLVCKTPITYMSLFETNAIYEELHLYHHFSQHENKGNPDKTVIDIIEYANQARRAYNSELIGYSAAAHMIAAYFKIPAILNVYDVASQLCTILLNLTEDHLLKLRRKVTAQHRYHAFFFMNRDFGYILYCICQDYKSIQKSKPHFNANQFLDFFGLPSLENTEQEIIDDMVKGVESFDKASYFHNRYKSLAMNGIDIFARMGLNSRKESMYTYFFTDNRSIEPLLIFGDEMWDESPIKEITKRDIMKISKHEWHDLVSDLKISEEELIRNLI